MSGPTRLPLLFTSDGKNPGRYNEVVLNHEDVSDRLAQMLSMGALGDGPPQPPPSSRGGRRRGTKNLKSKFVKFHPDDDPSIYPVKLLEHPGEFTPHQDWRGRISWWGFTPLYPKGVGDHEGGLDYDLDLLPIRKMASNFYKSAPLNRTPEQQFVDYLVDKQIKKLNKMNLGDLTRRDYTLKIVMDRFEDPMGNPRIWREFRVSGGISIAALADKVITPLMGWVRNYHAHAYTVFKDGAVYGPTESRAVDMMHNQSIGWGAIPQKSNRGNWTLAHLLQVEGQEMEWLYDYGDNWSHIISVEEIAPVSESTGKVAIIDGAGACPREDGGGNRAWANDMRKLSALSPVVRESVLAEIRRALNYKGKTIGQTFDPDNFDIAEARARVHVALASPDSVWSGPKTFVYEINNDEGEEASPTEDVQANKRPGPPGSMDELKQGQSYARTWDEADGARRYMQEVTSSKRDKKSVGCCWTCGTPHDLASCKGCRKPLYCGNECQKIHWKAGHKAQCAAAAAAA